MNTPGSDNTENTHSPPRRGRGPSERGRQIIALRDANVKQAAIAARVGCSVAAVKQVLRRHRRRQQMGYGFHQEPFTRESGPLNLHKGP
jgi:hypothetical protein